MATKTKEERFEKVVEWERTPDSDIVTILITSIIFSIISILILLLCKEIGITVIVIFGSIAVNIVLILSCFCRRKVYWRKIK